MSDFELQLLFHGSPAIWDMKQGNLFSLPLSTLPEYKQEVATYQKQLYKQGIFLDYLYCCCKRVFFFVYRKEQVLAYFNQPKVKTFLLSQGYSPDVNKIDTFSETLAYLRQRIRTNQDFPHEIGFFLGYPVDDVFAFIKEKGLNYKICGYWKVYHNELNALATFEKYTSLRNNLLHHAKKGVPISTLLNSSNSIENTLCSSLI